MNFSLQKLSPKGLGISGLILFLFGSGFGFFGFPSVLRSQIASQLALKDKSEMRGIWSNIPYPLDFKVYIFNVTNPMDVQNGGKPILNEVGPYFYEEFKDKLNLTDHDKDDTVSYNPRDTFYFNSANSEGLTGDEMLTIPHPALLAMVLSTEIEKPAALKLLNKAIPSVFNKPTSMFVTTTARKILFEGIPIYCNVTDFSGKALCKELKKREGDFHKLAEDVYGFSFFGTKNATAGGRFRVKRGIKDIKELGLIVEYDRKKKLTTWSGEECNKITGTDSTIFPPFLEPGDLVPVFSPDLCRTIYAHHTGNTTYKGFQASVYNGDFGDMSNNPGEKCFCTSPEKCWKKGVHDLTRCIGVPIIVSLPHFYLSDPEYLNGVIGLNPTKEKHEILSIFEPMTGSPLLGCRRAQLSIALHSVQSIDLLKEAPTVVFPIIWLHEGIELDKELLDKIRLIFKAITAMNVLKWLTMVLGGGLGAAGCYVKKRHTDTSTINVVPDVPIKMPRLTALEVKNRY